MDKKQQTTAERTGLINRQRRSEVSDVAPLPFALHVDERARGETDLQYFLRTFMPEKFYREFDPDMQHALARIQDSMLGGGTFAEAMPRGKGKTTAAEGAMLWAASYGHRKFMVVIASDQSKANDTLANIQAVVEGQCEKYCEAFPEVAYPVKRLEGRNQRAQAQHMAGTPTNMTWKADKLVLPSVEDSPSSGVILQAKGVTSKGIRGLNHKGARPDFILLDDPQDDESARSIEQTDKREKIIFGAVLGLAGHDKKISGVMTCTVIRRDDLAERFLDKTKHPEWQGYRTKLVDAWPTDQDAWDKYAEMWADERAHGEGTKQSTAYYKQNQKAMDDGARLSSPELYDKDCEISALQHAVNLRLEVGEDTFEAEYQNEPVADGVMLYELTPEVVASRQTNSKAGVAPEWAKVVVAATDINPSYALSTVVVAFDLNQRAAVLWYGTHKMNVRAELTERQKRDRIYKHLSDHSKEIADLPCPPSVWVIDGGGGGAPQGLVQEFSYSSPKISGLYALCCFGRGWKNYKPQAKKGYKIQEGNEFYGVIESVESQWIIYNADYWRETSQLGWIAEPGAPGSCTLPRGKHDEFCKQVTREPLMAKGEGLSGNTEWIFKQTNEVHDFGDCMHMAYMAAGIRGIGSSARITRKARPKRTRVKHVNV